MLSDALPCLRDAPAVAEHRANRAGDAEAVIARSARSRAGALGAASAVVTNPIQKKALNEIGFPFPAIRSSWGRLSENCSAGATTPVMMLAGELRVVPVTVHIPLAGWRAS